MSGSISEETSMWTATIISLDLLYQTPLSDDCGMGNRQVVCLVPSRLVKDNTIVHLGVSIYMTLGSE